MRGSTTFVVLVSLFMVTSIVAVPAAAAGGGSSDASTAGKVTGSDGVLPAPPDDQVLNASVEVKIWERSVFTLRADSSDGAFAVDNAAWDAELQGTGTQSLNKGKVAVYETNQQVSLTFDDGRAVAERKLANEGVQLVAARLDGNQSQALSSFSTLEGLESILTDENANDNATFEIVNSGTTLDGDGDRTFTYTPSQPGQYILFASKTENGSLSTTNGDIVVSGNVTVVGVDGLAVRRGAPSVSPNESQIDAGDSVSFSVNTGSAVQTQAGENVSHAILLYDEDTYTSGVFRLVADSHLDKDFSVSNNITLQHSIASVNGIQRSVGNAQVFGISAESGVSEGDNTLESTLNFLVQNTSLSSSLKPATSATDSTRLDASMTVVNGTASQNVLVKTRGDWRSACYRWIHVATNDSGTELASDTGTLGVGTSCPSDDDGTTTTGGGGGDDDGTTGTSGTTATTTGSATASVSTVGRQTTVNVEDASDGDVVRVQWSEQQVTDEVTRHGWSLESVEATFSEETDLDMQITLSNNKPDPNVPDPPSDRGTVGYINVQTSGDAVGQATFNFRVSQQRLDERGISRDEVVLYRYSGGEWSALETEFVGTAADGTPRFRAVSPDGFSIFAIGSASDQQQTTEAPPATTEAPPETTEAPPETTAAPPETPEEGGGISFVVVGIVIVAVLLVAGLWYFRDQF